MPIIPLRWAKKDPLLRVMLQGEFYGESSINNTHTPCLNMKILQDQAADIFIRDAERKYGGCQQPIGCCLWVVATLVL